MSNVIDFRNLGRKELRCMMYEVKEGDVQITYDNFEAFKEQYENVVEIYNPDKDQKKMILEIIGNNLELEENKIKTHISDEDFLLNLLEELSNIKMGLDRELDKEQIQSILDDPSDLLLRVKLEIDKICNNIFYLWYDTVKELLKTPEELKEALLLSYEENNTKDEPNPEEIEKQNKILELENQLKSLKGE